ncbi:unnamed protein product [[Candida] boidinii]|uniref:Unnamed protein product n=1 Tax=Candida boidinii TaxID=5477 RepID=A0A9W6SUX0_CANBO|nr:unnamed protein product [[Candida] boidinii]GMF53049.1 unnamed protein product [[Candida] boidinii]
MQRDSETVSDTLSESSSHSIPVAKPILSTSAAPSSEVNSTPVPSEHTISIDTESESSKLSSTSTSSFTEHDYSTYDSFNRVTETETVCNRCTESSSSGIFEPSVTTSFSSSIFFSSLIPLPDKSSYASPTTVSSAVISSSISIAAELSSISSSISITAELSSSASSFESYKISSYSSSVTLPVPEASSLTAIASSSAEAPDCDYPDNTGECILPIDTPSSSLVSSYPITIFSNSETIETEITQEQTPATVTETCSDSTCQHSYVSLTTQINKEVADSTTTQATISTSVLGFSEEVTSPLSTNYTTLLTTTNKATVITKVEETSSEDVIRESSSEITTQPEYPSESFSTSVTSTTIKSIPLELTKTFSQGDFTISTVSNFGSSNKELRNFSHLLFSLLSILFVI